MNKNRFSFCASAARAILCLAILVCFTSCFNLNSTQRGNFTFTISDAVIQQLENAMGAARDAGGAGNIITAKVELLKTDNTPLTEAVSKTGTLTSLKGDTITFEDIPLDVQFKVVVAFIYNGKELFTGESATQTLTSDEGTTVKISLKHNLDTDIVLPYWEYDEDEDEYIQLGPFRFDKADKINEFDFEDDEEAYSHWCGSEENCFDAYGNIWSITSDAIDDESYFNGCLYYTGSNGMPDVDGEDLLSVFKHGIIRALIPYAYNIECDYSTNSLFVFYADPDTDDMAVLKLSVDELLSIDTEKEIIVLRGIESLDDYWDAISFDDLQDEFTLRYVDPFISGNNGLLTLLYYNQTYPNIEYELVIEDFDFAVNNGTVYIACEVWDVNMDGNGNAISEKINGFYLVARDPAGTSQLKKLDINSIFGAGTDLRDINITDLLCLDGKLYALVSYRNTTGALVRIDPATLTFGASDVLGVSSDIKTVQDPDTPSTDGWWMYKSGSEVFDAHELYYEDSTSSPRWETGPTFNYLVSNDSNGFLGPVKFVAIKPKKLIVADYGIYYYDETRQDIKRRLLTINLTNFSIEASETKDLSFDIADRSDVEPAVSISYPFTEGQQLWYGGTYKQSITFTESMVAEYSGNSDLIPVGKMYYYY